MRGFRDALRCVLCAAIILVLVGGGHALGQGAPPTPLLAKDHPVEWWFAFKLNSKIAPFAGVSERPCPFGGEAQKYRTFSQAFAFASSDDHGLNAGQGLLGTGPGDPVGATYGAIYSSKLHYVVWNDQFYDDPRIAGCTKSCSGPWGHSKGLLAWDDAGDGIVLQVTTPDWPGSGSVEHPRSTEGNTLGCIKDNDVLVSQHFFALRLTHDDLIQVLKALINASVVTNPNDPQIVGNGGPIDVRALVALLGQRSGSQAVFKAKLSSGVVLVSKPSRLTVPPWQMLSAVLGGVPLRAATWWATPKIPTTTASTQIACWSSTLGTPGAVEIATSGRWQGTSIGLSGGPGPDFNHAKIGVSTSPTYPYVVFGDLNQQGALKGNCASSQNGRGGLFYVVEDAALAAGVSALIGGDTAPAP